MTTLDPDELRDLVKEVVTDVLSSQTQIHGDRSKYTRFESSDGKSWLSVTLERDEMIRKLAAFIIAITTIFSAATYVMNRMVFYPIVDERIAAHESNAERKMAEIRPTIVSRAEFDRRVASSDAKWLAADERYKTLTEWLTRIESKLDRAIEQR